jgi:hypothetical protein
MAGGHQKSSLIKTVKGRAGPGVEMNKVKDLTKCYSHEVAIHPGRSAFSGVWMLAQINTISIARGGGASG